MPRKTKSLAREKSSAIRRPAQANVPGSHKLARQTSPAHLLQQAFKPVPRIFYSKLSMLLKGSRLPTSSSCNRRRAIAPFRVYSVPG
jgi:hypothetical protein